MTSRPRIIGIEESEPLEHFFESVIALQEQDMALQLVQDHCQGTNNCKDVRINSLVFQLETADGTIPRLLQNTPTNTSTLSPLYVLAVLNADDYVNVSRLEEVIVSRLGLEADERRPLLSLAPTKKVAQLCGFEPGTVPPFGLSPAPAITVVENSLLSQSRHWMIGGGGLAGQSCRFRLDVLLGLDGVVMEKFRNELSAKRGDSTSRASQSLSKSNPLLSLTNMAKPYFPAETPPMDLAAQVIADLNAPNPLSPMEVSFVVKVARVRRMARRLVFCDVVPLEVDLAELGETIDLKRLSVWRSPQTGQEMSVQLIAGKTLCQTLGTEMGEQILRKGFQVGQIVWIQGRTNVGNRESLRNWVDKGSLDVVVWSCTPLSPSKLSADSKLIATKTCLNQSIWEDSVNTNNTKSKNIQSISFNHKDSSLLRPGMVHLKLENVFEAQHKVVVVNSTDKVREFQRDVELLSKTAGLTVELVGLDCEWKPNFLLQSKTEAQPVLILQISLQSLQKIYLWDLQTMLRPLQNPSEPRLPLEEEISNMFSTFFLATHFVKTGFQLAQDLRRLSASYPHISGFSQVDAVLELSTVAKISMYLSQQPNSRTVTSSLRSMVEHFLDYSLDKTEQVSDWSQRPLSPSQIEYAALDAAVTPKLLERILELIQGRLFAKPTLQIGRWLEDSSFSKSIQAWRFHIFDASNGAAIQRLQAKSIIHKSIYVVLQSWRTGSTPPSEPNVPTHEGPFIDSSGTYRVPAKLIKLSKDPNELRQLFNDYIGQRIAKTKDFCVSFLVQAFPEAKPTLKNGALIDFPQRSGFVEFSDAVILFVNMPMRPWAKKAQNYPNEWIEDGRRLTWFLRQKEWKNGSTPLAQTLLSSCHPVFLFVRLGKGHFVFCGCCRVSAEPAESEKRQWDLVKLYLDLIDWKALKNSPDFLKLLDPQKSVMNDLCAPPDQWKFGNNDSTGNKCGNGDTNSI